MKLLIIGAGGVGTSAAKIIERRGAEADWAEKVVVSDYDFERAKKVANEICGGGKFIPEQINAMDAESIKEVVKKHGITFVEHQIGRLSVREAERMGSFWSDCFVRLRSRARHGGCFREIRGKTPL